MLYSHDYVSRTETKFNSTEIKSLMSGNLPPGQDAKCNVTYDIVQYLINIPGPLPKSLWTKSVDTLGRRRRWRLCIMLDTTATSHVFSMELISLFQKSRDLEHVSSEKDQCDGVFQESYSHAAHNMRKQEDLQRKPIILQSRS